MSRTIAKAWVEMLERVPVTHEDLDILVVDVANEVLGAVSSLEVYSLGNLAKDGRTTDLGNGYSIEVVGLEDRGQGRSRMLCVYGPSRSVLLNIRMRYPGSGLVITYSDGREETETKEWSQDEGAQKIWIRNELQQAVIAFLDAG